MQFNILNLYKKALLLMLAIFVGSIFVISKYNFKYGIEFSGGTVIEVKNSSENLQLFKKNSKNIQYSEEISANNVKIKLNLKEDVEKLKNLAIASGLEIIKIQNIAPLMSKELYKRALKAFAVALFGVFLYTAITFSKKFATIACQTILLNILFLLALTAYFQFEMNFSIITALLIILGYSINDTIVVYDKIRSNVRDNKITETTKNINQSIRNVFKRCLITSFATIISSVTIAIISDISIREFSIIVSSGILFGTLCSVLFVPTLLHFFNVDLTTFNIKIKDDLHYNS
jgi:preprotein translocase subunit SecF